VNGRPALDFSPPNSSLAGRILGESLEADLRHGTDLRRSADPV
jgi:hypothetical protein